MVENLLKLHITEKDIVAIAGGKKVGMLSGDKQETVAKAEKDETFSYEIFVPVGNIKSFNKETEVFEIDLSIVPF